MKFNKLSLFILILFIIAVGITTVSASDNLNNDSLESDNIGDALEKTDEATLEVSDVDVLSEPKTIVIPFNPKENNDVLWPKIQKTIDGANSGDTIVIEGSPVHVHATINKTLTIVSGGQGTTIDACPHHTHEGIDEHGVFYITKEGSGSTIQGFTFTNKDKAETPFAILIDGANDITIKDCTIDYVNPDADKLVGIIIKNSNNVKLSNLMINNTINGITIINSSNVDITNCILNYNENYAISVSGDSRNINIKSNSIINNGNSGINLLSANYISILNNLIKNNGFKNDDSGSGIYVNTNITKLVVKGNIFLSNADHAILYDYRCRNLNNEEGADLLTDVDNNYFEGHSSMILHHRIYVERSYGDIKYDAENDEYGSVGEGNYVDSKSFVYMKNAFIFNDVPCGFTYYTTTIPWAVESSANNGKYDLSLKLNLNEIKNGVYQVSIVDSKGNVAGDFNSIYITVFLNDYSNVIPQSSNIYRNVLLKNGVGIADFRSDYSLFKSKDNIITAVFPGLDEKVERSAYVQLKVNDANLPFDPATKLTASKLTTYPLSDSYLSVKLTNSKGNAISNQKITFKFNGKTYSAITNANGVAKVKVSLTSKKTYSATISYGGNDDYKSSTVKTKIIVKSGSKKSKIKASNLKVKKNKKKTLKIKLTDNAGKALKKQKIVVKVNKKSYTIKTSSKGIAKLFIKLKKANNFKCVMKFLGNANYKASSKTITISVIK